MLDRLYEDIGKILKNWAKWIFIVESISAIIGGIAMIADDSDSLLVGLLVILVGPLIALVSTWALYGFGQLVDNSDLIVKEMQKEGVPRQKPIVRKEERLPQKPIIRSEDGPQTIKGVPGVARKMIVCPKCGKSQFDGNRNCFACGTLLKTEE